MLLPHPARSFAIHPIVSSTSFFLLDGEVVFSLPFMCFFGLNRATDVGILSIFRGLISLSSSIFSAAESIPTSCLCIPSQHFQRCIISVAHTASLNNLRTIVLDGGVQASLRLTPLLFLLPLWGVLRDLYSIKALVKVETTLGHRAVKVDLGASN
jgi:hypothetical protein